MTSEQSGSGGSGDSPSSTASQMRKLLLGLGLRPEHEEPTSRRRAEWASEMIQRWEMNDAIQMLNEMAVRELLAADPDDHPALLRARIKLEVVSDFQWTLQMMVDEYTSLLSQLRQREDAIHRGDSVE